VITRAGRGGEKYPASATFISGVQCDAVEGSSKDEFAFGTFNRGYFPVLAQKVWFLNHNPKHRVNWLCQGWLLQAPYVSDHYFITICPLNPTGYHLRRN